MGTTQKRCSSARGADIMPETPVDALQRQAEACPDDTAFIAGEETWTYRRLASKSERLASAMLTRGIQAGDRVALHMANLPELAVAYYACFRIGAIAAPLNIRLKTAELRPMLQRLRPALYVGQDQLYPQVAPVEPEILPPGARFTVGASVGDGRAQPWTSLLATAAAVDGPIPHSPGPDAPAVLLATSGTTGQPKFVAYTPASLSSSIGTIENIDLDGEQVALLATPMVHAAGFATFLGCIRVGAPIVLLDRFDPDAALDAIEARRCTWMLGLPFMYVELMRRQRARSREIGALRHCISTGDTCPPDLQEAFAEAFGVPLRSVLASTEMGWSLTYGLQPGPVSRIAPGTQVRLVDNAGAPVPRGEVGELLVRGPGLVGVGYWAGPGRVEAALEDGWFRTGDLLRQGDGDDLWFVARKKDLIVRGGSNIAPVEVERVLTAHPAVRDAAVVGVPDPVLGQRVAALVQLADDVESGAVLESVRAAASTQLADYKVPERLLAVDAIPRNAAGKTDRAAVLAMVPGSEANAFSAIANDPMRRDHDVP